MSEGVKAGKARAAHCIENPGQGHPSSRPHTGTQRPDHRSPATHLSSAWCFLPPQTFPTTPDRPPTTPELEEQ